MDNTTSAEFHPQLVDGKKNLRDWQGAASERERRSTLWFNSNFHPAF
jgi:hypothetical protein